MYKKPQRELPCWGIMDVFQFICLLIYLSIYTCTANVSIRMKEKGKREKIIQFGCGAFRIQSHFKVQSNPILIKSKLFFKLSLPDSHVKQFF